MARSTGESVALVPEEARRTLRPLYGQEHENDPVTVVKFFTPWTPWI